MADASFPQPVDIGLLIKDLYHAADFDGALGGLVERSVALMDGCDYAGVTMIEGSKLRTAAFSHPIVLELDRIQYELGEGPCVTALEHDHAALTEDTERERRWPRFTDAMADRGVQSLLALPLTDPGRDRETAIGALNLYSTRLGAFTERDRLLGSVLAAAASVAIAAARQLTTLADALRTRELIGEAKGMLMSRHGVSEDEAFAMLRQVSQRTNERLRDVAARLVHERGDLDGEPPGVRCTFCGARVPLERIESSPTAPLGYTCPSCNKRADFSPAAAFAKRREALVDERNRLVAERDAALDQLRSQIRAIPENPSR